MSENFWEQIPRGKTDPPMLMWNLSQPIEYDFNDPDSQYVMFNRDLEGCFALPFSKAMRTDIPGHASVDGKPVSARIAPVALGGFDTFWLGLKLGGVLHGYGKEVSVELGGFTDTDGNAMQPAVLRVRTPDRVLPQEKYAGHEAIALQAARDGIVLLKNEDRTLPLPAGTVLNFFGKGIHEFRLGAVGAGKIFPRYAVGLLEAAEADGGYSVNRELVDFYTCGVDVLPDETVTNQAIARSDTAILVLSRAGGENTDSSTRSGEYLLTANEETLLGFLRERFRRLVVVLNTAYPIAVDFAERYKVDALVYCGLGGMLGGRALMDVLSGRVNPSGKLPDTWYACYDEVSSSKNFYNAAGGNPRIGDDGKTWIDTVYEEDIYVGYRYTETFPTAGKRGFPFGFGLSYTTFDLRCETVEYTGNELRLALTVRNTGSVPGRETAQIYLSKPQGRLEQPARELIAFAKTKELAPGESQRMELTIPDSRMTSYDEASAAYVMVSGEYQVLCGSSVRDARPAGSFVLNREKTVKRVKNRMQPNTTFRRLSQSCPEAPAGTLSGVREGASRLEPEKAETEQFHHEPFPKADRPITFRDVLRDESLLKPFVGGLDCRTLARLSVCAKDGWGVEGRGEAGTLYRPDGLDLPSFTVADGNSGVNLRERNIGMPSGATLCASFDRELMEQVGRVIGEEARELGIDLILAPALNLHRNPLNGRQPEYFSEDPCLAGIMAGSYCRGLESTGVGGCYKHLIANNAESGRKRNQSILSERAIRELYFRAFEYALEEHQPVSVMTAYNAVNGVFASCDPELIQGLLWEECSFCGFVMTDWSSYDSADVAEMAVAGVSWITPGSTDDTYTRQIEDAVADGRLSPAQLQENVFRLLQVLAKLHRGKCGGSK